MKESRKEPAFNVELDHNLRHIILKRGHMLRSTRTTSVMALAKGRDKSWLQAKLPVSAGQVAEESWDKAHDLADRFKRELHQDVFVEPGSTVGRYSTTCAPDHSSGDDDSHPHSEPFHASPLNSSFSPYPSGVGGNVRPQISPMGFGGGMPGHAMPGMHGPKLPTSGLPPEIEALISNRPTVNRKEFTCPPLRQLPGWEQISLAKQQMFETEAAQLIKGGLSINTNEEHPLMQRSTLEMVRLQPKVSRELRRFLDQALLPLTTAD